MSVEAESAQNEPLPPNLTRPGSADENAIRPGAIATLWRLRRWGIHFRWSILTMILAATLAMSAQTMIPLIIGRMVDGPIADHDPNAIWPLAALALLFGVAEAILFGVRRFAMTRASLGIETEVRRDLFAQLQRLPVAFHDGWSSGQLLSRISTDLSTIQRFVGYGFVFLFANVVTISVVLILLIHLQVWLGLLVTLAILPVVYATRSFEKHYGRDARRAQDLTGDLATSVEESALGIRVIKSYGRGPEMITSFMRDAEVLRRAEITKISTQARFWSVLEGQPQLVVAAVTCLGVLAVAHGSMSSGQLVAFLTLCLRLIWPLIFLGWNVAVTEEAITATQRIFEVLDTEPTIVDPPQPRRLTGPATISFDDVHFHYPDTDHEVLRGVNLEVRDGETLAIVGGTGSGKTTLTSLVTRLYDVTGGQVSVCGEDVRSVALDELRSCISMAFEDATLFSATVAENLLLGRPEASEADVAEAIEIAQAQFAYDLPDGLQTRIGEQGLSLSGGQRQRLALARAVLGQPRIMVLDDPLSALDIHTEGLVEQALRRVLHASTAIIVAHRPSTVLLADRVALLVDGRVAAVGTHSQLLAENPAYRNLLAQEAAEVGSDV
ncbi:ATP-binding cassette subfamily B protein [Jatrophihabitans sp. GAS493]|nr:ABC transporter ATP-binding protein [Jatrophihabitans sp. GAS493]SOD70421.1 ATP-binding cassette subfamily B protein [Jatrophihabitans sp. GAS493]